VLFRSQKLHAAATMKLDWELINFILVVSLMVYLCYYLGMKMFEDEQGEKPIDQSEEKKIE